MLRSCMYVRTFQMLLTLPWLFENANFISPVRLDGNTSQFGTAVEQLSRVVLYLLKFPYKTLLACCPYSGLNLIDVLF